MLGSQYNQEAMIKLFPRSTTLINVLILLLSACARTLQSPASQPQVSNSPIPLTTINPVVQITASTSTPGGSYIVDAVPPSLREQVQGLDIRLDISSSIQSDSNETRIQWLYALVAPFPTVKDGVTFDELRMAWTE